MYTGCICEIIRHTTTINQILQEVTMQTFVLMTKLAPEMSKKIKDQEKLGRVWLDQVKEKCPEVNFVAHYALLGPYDYLDIYEAPNEEIAAKVSLISLQTGAFQAESWVAIPYKRFVELAEEI
jgi:uncharacterized protein with GYD domain